MEATLHNIGGILIALAFMAMLIRTSLNCILDKRFRNVACITQIAAESGCLMGLLAVLSIPGELFFNSIQSYSAIIIVSYFTFIGHFVTVSYFKKQAKTSVVPEASHA